MTNTLKQSSITNSVRGLFSRAWRLLTRAGFGVFLFLAFIATLIATTFVGIFLAIAAVFLTLGQKFGRRRKSDASEQGQWTGSFSQSQDANDNTGQGAPETLDAHQTPEGWVTEDKSSKRWR